MRTETRGLISRGGIRLPGLRKRLFGIGRRLAGEQVVHRSADRVDVGAHVGVTGVAAILFQRRIGDRAAALHDRHRTAFVGLEQLDQPEIHQLDNATRGELDVRRLDVAVEHRRILRVEIGQGVAKLSRPGQHALSGRKVSRRRASSTSWRKSWPGIKSITRYSRPSWLKKSETLGRLG